MNIVNALADVAMDYLPETMSTEVPNIAQRGRLPDHKANPSYLRYTVIGGLLGVLLCAAWFVIKSLTDETIRTSEEMERFFGMPPLTIIPYVGAFEQDSQKHSSALRRSHGKHRQADSGRKAV